MIPIEKKNKQARGKLFLNFISLEGTNNNDKIEAIKIAPSKEPKESKMLSIFKGKIFCFVILLMNK